MRRHIILRRIFLLLALTVQVTLAAADDCTRNAAESAVRRLQQLESLHGRAPEFLADQAKNDPLEDVKSAVGPRAARVAELAFASPVESVREAGWTMLMAQGEQAAQAGLERLMTHAQPRVRKAVPSAFVSLAGVRSGPALVAMAKDGDHQVRMAVAQAVPPVALDERVPSTVMRHLEQVCSLLVHDADPRVRQAMLLRAAELPDQPHYYAVLVALAADVEEGLAARAGAALAARTTDTDRTVEAVARPVTAGDPVRRVSAAVALGALGDARAAPALLRLLGDSDAEVRCAAVEALGDLPLEARQQAAFARALPNLLRSREWWLRATVAESVARHGLAEAVPLLIATALRAESLEQQAIMMALEGMTGQPFRDPAKWQAWYAKEGRKVPVTPMARPAAARDITFCSVTDRVAAPVFVVDTSGSMSAPLHAGDSQGARQTTRIEAAKQELQQAVFALSSSAQMSVIFFQSDVTHWRALPVRATWRNKVRLEAHLPAIRAGGNTAANAVLLEALEVAGSDAIYFLTDGMPTDGAPDQIRAAVVQANARRSVPVRIHAIAFHEQGAEAFLRGLADDNGGLFQEVQ